MADGEIDVAAGVLSAGTWVLLRKDLADSGAIRTPADLRGRNIALVSRGSSVEYFASQRIDAAIGGEPTATSYVDKQLATKWLCAADIMPDLQYTYILFSPQFADKRADIAQAWRKRTCAVRATGRAP